MDLCVTNPLGLLGPLVQLPRFPSTALAFHLPLGRVSLLGRCAASHIAFLTSSLLSVTLRFILPSLGQAPFLFLNSLTHCFLSSRDQSVCSLQVDTVSWISRAGALVPRSYLPRVTRSPCCVGPESALEKAPFPVRLLSWLCVLQTASKTSISWLLASGSTKQLGASGP